MKDALLQAIGAALDGLEIGFCAFDAADRTLAWNATFLDLFPEHDGHLHAGEPYAANLRRFYEGRLGADELARIDRYIAEGVARHRTQRRPYEFDHRDYRVRVSSFEIGRFGRLRVWRKVAALPTRVHRPVSSTQALAQFDATAVLERLADGVVVVDVADRVMWANRSFLDLYGVRALETALGQRFDAIYRAAWAGREHQEGFASSLAMLGDNQRFSGAPFEVRLPGDRFVRVMEQRGEVDGHGYFVHVDVTHLKRQQLALVQAEDRYRLLAQHSSDIILSIEDGLLTYASPALTELLGWDAAEVLGQPVARFTHPDDLGPVVSALLTLRARPEADYRARALHKDGSHVWVEARARLLPGNGQGAAARFVINARGIAARKAVEDELERAKQRLQELAATDGLTGLANRRKLDESLALEFRRAQREGRPLALLVLDIDHFKRLNDSHGHQVGDAVLRKVGALLATVPQRAGDLVARLGGEEFVVLLPNTDEERAAGVAEKVRQAVEETRFEPPVQGTVTVSIGVAAAGGAGIPDAPEALLGRADRALYAAKRGGRNRVVVA